MMKSKRIIAAGMLIILTIILFSINVFAACDAGLKTQVDSYYDAYGINQFATNYVKDYGPKYSDNAADMAKLEKYGYAITFVSNTGEVCNLYADELPKDFGIWATNVTVNEGRVVVTGVNGNDVSTWNLIYDRYKLFIVGISGLGAITCMLAFVMFFMKMGANSGNPGERSKTLTMLLFTGAGAAGLGAVTIIFGFFWNIV